jgi:hypothetical protein
VDVELNRAAGRAIDGTGVLHDVFPPRTLLFRGENLEICGRNEDIDREDRAKAATCCRAMRPFKPGPANIVKGRRPDGGNGQIESRMNTFLPRPDHRPGGRRPGGIKAGVYGQGSALSFLYMLLSKSAQWVG